ncbi:hypothetical protein [Nitrosarchaeum sp.]|uniref:hypothetical protein n=1 Tax=Nitrosarchaeum sp. TaxID=2026886 RepID=UPI00247E812D|nr:hypothetical protein [Nitrosarchaeum sp.]MCV0412514.1 hypothetical protein [Nitrosarchaeum sp.]
MVSKAKKVIIIIVIALGLFAYSQYVLASQIGVKITQSDLLAENESGVIHDVVLEFSNPSLLYLTAGKTEFFVVANEEMIGRGDLESFVLPALGSSSVSGTYMRDSNVNTQEDSTVKISGVIKYDVIFTSIDVPFVYYPTPDQAREFIREN